MASLILYNLQTFEERYNNNLHVVDEISAIHNPFARQATEERDPGNISGRGRDKHPLHKKNKRNELGKKKDMEDMKSFVLKVSTTVGLQSLRG